MRPVRAFGGRARLKGRPDSVAVRDDFNRLMGPLSNHPDRIVLRKVGRLRHPLREPPIKLSGDLAVLGELQGRPARLSQQSSTVVDRPICVDGLPRVPHNCILVDRAGSVYIPMNDIFITHNIRDRYF
jgi:hypothetical protein